MRRLSYDISRCTGYFEEDTNRMCEYKDSCLRYLQLAVYDKENIDNEYRRVSVFFAQPDCQYRIFV